MFSKKTLRLDRIGLYDAYLATLGGGENFLAVFAELLEQEFPGSEIDILTHEGNHVGIEALAHRFGVVLDRTRVRRVEHDSRHGRIPIHLLRRFRHEQYIARLSSEYDLFLNNTVFSIAPPRARHSIYMCMFPLSPIPAAFRNHSVRRWLSAPSIVLRSLLYHRWLRRYDLLLANSEFTRGWIRRFWRLDAKVLYPPIETRSRLRLDPKSRKILAIGRFFPGSHNKKHDVLIRAFRRLRWEGMEGWELHLVGGKTPVAGTESYLARLRSLAQGEPVVFHLDAPKAELDHLLETSSLFWHATGFGEEPEREPEKLEHFGMSTVEAMTHGCVPVVYACGGQPEIIEPGVSGFLWETLDELHGRTLELARDRRTRETMAQAAHARSQHFSRDAFRERSRKLLDLLLA